MVSNLMLEEHGVLGEANITELDLQFIPLEKDVLSGGPFRMLEEEKVEPFLQKLPAKEVVVPPPLATPAAEAQPEGGVHPARGDEDVQFCPSRHVTDQFGRR